MTCCIGPPSLSLCLMFWFACDAVVALANWWFCTSRDLRDFDKTASTAHGVLSVIGFFMYFGLASPLFYYPHYYRERLRMWDRLVNRPQGRKDFGQRTWRTYTILGIWVSFLVAFPRFCVELHLALSYGWIYVLQGIAVLTSFLTTFCGFLAVWGSYLWKASKRFQIFSLNTMGEDMRRHYLDCYKEGPYEFLKNEVGEAVWVTGQPLPQFLLNSPFYTFYPDAGQHSPQEIEGKMVEGEPALAVTGLHFPPQDPDLSPLPQPLSRRASNPLVLADLPPFPPHTQRIPMQPRAGEMQVVASSDITFVE
eukprot:TRINITY_DN30746_c0_g1_i1.p1 TRINITY_DN30746_c0_g1~~TRINITY_DN30746_c0_g1_i1.p1  ORF type:complete len:332 (+),score=31.45 TRINITY_DN30746_c0_g1_i1:75-998(+)